MPPPSVPRKRGNLVGDADVGIRRRVVAAPSAAIEVRTHMSLRGMPRQPGCRQRSSDSAAVTPARRSAERPAVCGHAYVFKDEGAEQEGIAKLEKGLNEDATDAT